MRDVSPIDILMATYNGESHVGAQIDSLLKQNYQKWKLIIRDDGSQDGTVSIIQDYRARHPDKIILLEDDSVNLGPCGNYARLLALAGSDYIMLCDQDDVWLPHKVNLTLNKMKDIEQAFGKKTPILVHADAKVVDENLQEMAGSLWHYQKSDPEKGSALRRLLLQNVATGCTVMVNKALLVKALPVPDEVMMHDWWLVLVAAAFGHIGYVSEPTLLYRQHGRNDTGAKHWNATIALQRLLHVQELLASLRDGRIISLRLEKQSDVFLRRFFDVLNNEDKNMLVSFSHLSSRSYFRRRYDFIKYGFFYTDPVRNIGRMLFA